jgi:chemotaxis protein CheZ
MTDSADDLEALFEEMASQRQETLSAAPETTSAESTAAPQTEEDPAGKLDLSGTSDDANLPIFDRLGNVVRMLHDSMRALGYDRLCPMSRFRSPMHRIVWNTLPP